MDTACAYLQCVFVRACAHSRSCERERARACMSVRAYIACVCVCASVRAGLRESALFVLTVKNETRDVGSDKHQRQTSRRDMCQDV